MTKDTERASPPLHIHFGDRMLEDAARDVADVVRRAEKGESIEPQRHLSFEGWDSLVQALRVAGLDEQASATVIGALKGMAGEDEFSFVAPGDGESPAPWDRSALADLRRKWLHYHALGERTIAGQRVADDLTPIVPAFEVVCDELDRLRQYAEGRSAPAGFTDSRNQADADAYDGRRLDEPAAATKRGEYGYVPGEQAEADIARLRGCLRRPLQEGSGASTGGSDREDSYKGYAPDIRIDPATGMLHAVASGISDVVHAEGRTAADLWQAFRNSVDEYLTACAEKDHEPQPTPSSAHGGLLEMLSQDEGVEDGPDDPDPFAVRGDDRDALLRELQRLRQDCADAYQVVGTLGAAAGVLGSTQLAKALDNLSAASQGEARPHEDLLPFILTSSDKQ